MLLANILEFFTGGGFFMWPLLACSVCAATIVVWRLLVLRQDAMVPNDLAQMLENVCEGNRPPEGFVPRLLSDQSSLGKLAREALQMHFAERTEAEKVMEARAREELTRLQRGLPALEIIVQASPLLGLLGTVAGLVTMFQSFGGTAQVAAGAGDPRLMAAGIAEAMNTTVFGLSVALPALLAHGYIQRLIEEKGARLEVILTRVVAARFNGTVSVN